MDYQDTAFTFINWFGCCGDEGHVFFRLMPCIKNNVGFVFTREDLVEVRELLLSNKVMNRVHGLNSYGQLAALVW